MKLVLQRRFRVIHIPPVKRPPSALRYTRGVKCRAILHACERDWRTYERLREELPEVRNVAQLLCYLDRRGALARRPRAGANPWYKEVKTR